MEGQIGDKFGKGEETGDGNKELAGHCGGNEALTHPDPSLLCLLGAAVLN